MGSLLAAQLTQLAGDLPRYQSTMSEKIQSFRETKAGRSTLERASEILKDLSKELDKPKDAAAASVSGSVVGPNAQAPSKPVPVEVRQPDPGALESLRTLISPLIHPIATTGIIIVFVIFILLQREDLRNRLIRLAGSSDLQRTTAALDDAASRLSRLFLTQHPKWRFRFGDRDGSVVHRDSQRDPLGHPGGRSPLRSLHRRYHRGRVPARVGSGHRSRLDDAAMDSRAISCGGAGRRTCDRADGLRTQHRAFSCCGGCGSDVLDRIMGANRARPSDAADSLPRCAWTPCGTFGIS